MPKNLKRFLISEPVDKPAGSFFVLSKKESHHLKDVLRIKVGAQCVVSDPTGQSATVKVDKFLKDNTVQVVILSGQDSNKPHEGSPSQMLRFAQHDKKALHITVAQAIPQRGKMDDIVESAAELGIEAFIPLITDRTQVRMKESETGKVLARWTRIAQETIKQSGVSLPPQIYVPTKWKDLWGKDYDHRLVFHTAPDALPVKEALKGVGGNVLIVVGPEGGFSPAEIQDAKRRGAKLVNLKTGILKTDTAFISAVTCLKVCAD